MSNYAEIGSSPWVTVTHQTNIDYNTVRTGQIICAVYDAKM